MEYGVGRYFGEGWVDSVMMLMSSWCCERNADVLLRRFEVLFQVLNNYLHDVKAMSHVYRPSSSRDVKLPARAFHQSALSKA